MTLEKRTLVCEKPACFRSHPGKGQNNKKNLGRYPEVEDVSPKSEEGVDDI